MQKKSKDLFSDASEDYAHYRPRYPEELFLYLSQLVKERQCAWDVATGNGQAAVMLAHYFDQVIATDLSAHQIANAVHRPNITYGVGRSEQTDLQDHSVDLITVAQAFHWFDHACFAREVKRVAKNEGILAVWCYGLFRSTKKLDQIIYHLYNDVLDPFWEPERAMVENNYQSISMPFLELPPTPFPMSARWTFEHLVGYIKTWSAIKKYNSQKNLDPLEPLLSDLKAAFGKDKLLEVTWTIHPRVWRL